MTGHSRAWSLAWLIWFVVWFAWFLGMEIYTLITNWQNTLSANVWRFEKFKPGQPIHAWSVSHLMFIGLFVLIFGWLLMHFGDGWWRS